MINDTLPTVALSIRQPWAHLVASGEKPVENRSRRTRFRGRFLIHASKKMTLDDWCDFVVFTERRGLANVLTSHPQDLAKGGIIGVAEIVDCVASSTSPWFVGPWGYVIANARPLPFKACGGMLGFFKCDYTSLKP